MRARHPLLRRLAMAALATLLGLAGLEGLAILVEAAPYGALKIEGTPAGLYRSTPRGVAGGGGRPQLRPGAHLKGLLYEIHVNGDGFRGPELARPKPASGLRLWCMGGSSTFDIYAPDDDATWPALAGAAVQRALPDRRVDVVNAGIPGEILEGNVTDLVALAGRLGPDVVVIHQGPNEIRRTLPQRPIAAGGGGAARLPPLATPRLLRSWISRWVPPTDFPDEAEFGPEQVALARRRLDEAVERAEGLADRVVLATHGLAASADPPPAEIARLNDTARTMNLRPSRVVAATDRYASMVREVALSHGLVVADLRARIPADERLWADGVHFTAAGSAMAAGIVAEAVLESLRRPRARPTSPIGQDHAAPR